MFRNYFKIAWRNLWKNKLFSIINVISLAIGLSASFVIGMMVYYDFTFDKFHPDGDRIYRVTTQFNDPEGDHFSSGIPFPLVDAVKNEVSGLETAAFFHQFSSVNVKPTGNEELFKQQDFVVFTDHGYFDLFDYNWLAGSAQKTLSQPNEVVLTEARAKLYFPNLSPSQVMGKTLNYNDSIPAVVTGVVANFEERSDLIFQEFLSLDTASQTNIHHQISGNNWYGVYNTSQLWIKLEQGTLLNNFQAQLDDIAGKHQMEEDLKLGSGREFYSQPLKDLHFNDELGIYDPEKAVADKDVIIMLGLLALFLLLLGCANFINLNTAQASKRAKEIGIRKTLGSSKGQLILQFLGETFLLTLIAGAVSIILSMWLIRIFDDFIADGIDISLLMNPVILLSMGTLLVIVTIAAGFYPGIVLSKFKPVRVLKGKNTEAGAKNQLRKFLTVFQFTIAFVFIISTFLVGKQISFLINKDMGFKTESVAFIETPHYVSSLAKQELLAQKLANLSSLKKVSLGGQSPASFDQSTTSFISIHDGEERKTSVRLLFGDPEYLDLYEIPLLAGRKPLNDTIKEIVINTKALEKMGFDDPNQAVNQKVTSGGVPYLITGVMADFNQGSLKQEIGPMAFAGGMWRSSSSGFKVAHFSFSSENYEDLTTTIADVKSIYKEVYPNEPIDLKFMDETILTFYKKEQSMSKLLNWAMGLSVLISCLGLLGLVIYTTERRVKEIGIRKVLGASIVQINTLLCKDFVILIFIAFVIAIPIAYYTLDDWLQDFANRTELSWWIFAGSGIAMILLALIIMSIRTIATAMADPVKSLRTE
jgi:ABC-type antimicrobial peptide transport system permease subunit